MARWKAAAVFAGIVLCASGSWIFARRGPSPDRRFRDAVAALKTGNLDAVAAASRRLESVPGFEERARYLRAAYFVKTGNSQQAQGELEGPIKSAELWTEMQLLAAELHYRDGRLALAEAAARRVLEDDSKNIVAHRWLASILYDLGANQAAEDELGVLMSLAPADFTAYHLLAVIRLDAERFADAAETFREALARDPPPPIRPGLVRGLVQSLVGQHEYAAALSAVAAEAPSHPLPPDAARLALEAECHWSLGQIEKSRELLDRAAEVDPAEPRVPQLRARLLIEAGRAADAIPLLEEVLTRDPHDFESRYRLSLAFRRLGQADRADEEMRRMKESQALRRRLTDLSDQAVAEPRNAVIRDDLARICEELGKPDLARLYRQAAAACRAAAPANDRGGK